MKIIKFWRAFKRAPETALYAFRRSFLPENGTYATPFLSDVYNNSTRARKRLAGVSLYAFRWLLPQNVTDTTQHDDDVCDTDRCRKAESAGNGVLSSGEKNFSVHKTYMNFLRPRKSAPDTTLYALRGRSMVEMLGVLAIIGVLSVGAIAGYSKAMKKYWENKFIAATSELIINAKTIIETTKLDFGDANSYRMSAELAKLNLLPPPYKYNGSSIEYLIPYHARQSSWSQVDFNGINLQLRFSGVDKETCHLLLIQDWTGMDYQYVSVKNNELYPVFRGKLSLDQINNICNITSSDDENSDVYGRSAITLGFGI